MPRESKGARPRRVDNAERELRRLSHNIATPDVDWSDTEVGQEILSKINNIDSVPIGTIIQNNQSFTNDNYKQCDGSNVSRENYPNLSPTYVKFYRLCNLTRSTYDDNGNITFRFFHNDLWTTDPDICKKKNPDLRNLYRRLRYRGDDDLGGATEHEYILNYNRTDYQRFGENYNFINVQEEITMTNGVITSPSEFYDGEYRVELTEFIEIHAITGDSLNYINRYNYKDYNAVADTTQGDTETNKGYYIEGATQQKPHYYFFSTAETDRKISDNQYLTWCVDGKQIVFNDGENLLAVDVTHKVISTENSSATPCTIMFDFITPPTFVATRDIFHGYRSLIFRIADTTGKLNMYMAGFKSNNALKWCASNVFTGYTLKPNRKYRLVYRCAGVLSTDNSYPLYHYLNIYEYDELEKFFTNADYDSTGKFGSTGTGAYELNYFPYNYYSSYGMRTLYTADATAWTQGLFIDLLSLRIQHVGDTTYQNYGNEFRMAKLYYQNPVDNGSALPRITGKDGCESYIKVK